MAFDKGSGKGDQARLAVSSQDHNVLSLIIAGNDKKILSHFEKGAELSDLNFYSPIAVLKGTAVVSEKMEIASGPEKGNFQIDISIVSI